MMSRLKKAISLLLVVVMLLSVLPVSASAADVNVVFQAELREAENIADDSDKYNWPLKGWLTPIGYEPHTVSVDARVVGAETGKFRFFTNCGDATQYTDWDLTSEWQTFSVTVTPTWGGIDLGVCSAGTACTIEFDNLKVVDQWGGVKYNNEHASMDGLSDYRLNNTSVIEYLLDNTVLEVAASQEAVSVTQDSGVNMVPGDEYTLIFWVMGEGDVTVSTGGGGPEGSSVTATAGSSWKKVKSVFVAGETDTGAIVPTVTSVPGSGTVYVDHISIMDWNGTEFVTNGDFENGLEGWTGGTLAEVKEWPNVGTAGNRVLRLVADAWSNAQTVMDSIHPGTFKVSYVARGDGTMKVGFRKWDSNKDYSTVAAELTRTWTKYEGEVTVTEDWDNLVIELGEGGKAWIDDIEIRDAADVVLYQWDMESGLGNSYKNDACKEEWLENSGNPYATWERIAQNVDVEGETLVSNGVLEVHSRPVPVGDNVWPSLYMYDNGHSDVSGKRYHMSFWAKADPVKPVGTIRMTFGEWGNATDGGNVSVTPTTEWVKYTTTFVQDRGWANVAIYSEYIGGEDGVVYIDNWSIVDDEGNEVVSNGSFDAGRSGWNVGANSCGDGFSASDAFRVIRMKGAPVAGSEDLYNVEYYRNKGSYTAPVREGKVFAGWYTNAACTTPLAEDVTTGNAYAKFVDAGVLGVKWQITAGTTAGSEKTNLRLLTSVDTLNYSQVGFVVDAGDGKVREPYTNTVYRKITGYVDETSQYYAPTIFSSASQYFMAYNYNNVPSSVFDTEIKVTPRWVTLDGTVVTGATETVVISSAFGG